ncbi:hypothetical protein TARUN_3852 [Trichoderma arundinaceum]|uniref:NAD-dependent epimerase/dehydratase domain-containing protein n=1 Tax=Trichoderma arundinaceum TaxID=490622 RepID=A0A395NQH7_TRIAR|nr:hypothetical protein TARUN_3852 [Trichoderma arundinaceum]
MAKDLVLLTGATGYLGYIILVDLLKHGYHVRAAVRSMEKAEKVIAAPSIKEISPSADQLSFALVSNMGSPGAYDEAVTGVKYIIHAAAPIPTWGQGEQDSDTLERRFIKPSERGVIELLNAAASKAGGTVKRVVMTSTTGAILPVSVVAGEQLEPSRIWDPEDRTEPTPPPYSSEFQAYAAAKVKALQTSEDFIKTNKPPFDLITIFPPWIWSRDELVSTAKDMLSGSSNAVLLGLLTGEESDFSMIGNAAHGQDVARAHVAALNPEVAGNQSFVVIRDIVWEDSIAIAKKSHPGAFADGRLKAGRRHTIHIKWNTAKTENQLGLRLQPFEAIVESVVGQYLELLDAEKRRVRE